MGPIVYLRKEDVYESSLSALGFSNDIRETEILRSRYFEITGDTEASIAKWVSMDADAAEIFGVGSTEEIANFYPF